MKLNPDSQITLTEAVIAETSQQFCLEPISWSPVEEGIGNTVAKITTADGNYYAKYYNTKHPVERVIDEIVLMSRASTLDIPVPSLLSTLSGSYSAVQLSVRHNMHQVTVTTELRGNHPERYGKPLIIELALAHAALHNTEINTSSASPLAISDNYHFAGPESMPGLSAIDAKAHRFLHEIDAESLRLPKGLGHLDISTSNVMEHEGRLSGILDFEDTAIAPYVLCLAGTLWDVKATKGSDADVQTYIDAYQSIRQLNETELRFLDRFVYIRGWLALHGTLLTTQDETVAEHQSLLLQEIS